MPVVTRRRVLRARSKYLWAGVAIIVILAVVTVVINAAHRASAEAADKAARIFEVSVRAETVGTVPPALEGYQAQADLLDDRLQTRRDHSPVTVTGDRTSVIRLNLDASAVRADHEVVRAADGNGSLVITDWISYASEGGDGGGSIAGFTGWAVQWLDAAPGEYVIETPIRWASAGSKTGNPEGRARVRVHITVAAPR